MQVVELSSLFESNRSPFAHRLRFDDGEVCAIGKRRFDLVDLFDEDPRKDENTDDDKSQRCDRNAREHPFLSRRLTSSNRSWN